MSETIQATILGYDLTTLAAVKMEFDIRTNDDDVYLQRQITRASSSIASYCRRIFAKQRYRDTFQSYWRWAGQPVSKLALAHWPVVQILSVDVNGVEIDDFTLDAESGRLIRNEYWESGIVEVEYTAGWILPAWVGDTSGQMLPQDVEKACIYTVLAQRQVGRLAYTDRDPFLRSETVEGVGSLTYSQQAIGSVSGGGISTIPQSAKEDLEPYRVPLGAS